MTQTRQLFGPTESAAWRGIPLTRESTYLMVVRWPRSHSGERQTARRHWPGHSRIEPLDCRSSMAGLASVGVVVQSAGVITTPALPTLRARSTLTRGSLSLARTIPGRQRDQSFLRGRLQTSRCARTCHRKEIFALLQGSQARPQPDSIPPLSSLPATPAFARSMFAGWLRTSHRSEPPAPAVDCANGAAAVEAPELFRALRVPATYLHSAPDGQTSTNSAGRFIPRRSPFRDGEQGKFDLGVTFDGDADRALFVTARARW